MRSEPAHVRASSEPPPIPAGMVERRVSGDDELLSSRAESRQQSPVPTPVDVNRPAFHITSADIVRALQQQDRPPYSTPIPIESIEYVGPPLASLEQRNGPPNITDAQLQRLAASSQLTADSRRQYARPIFRPVFTRRTLPISSLTVQSATPRSSFIEMYVQEAPCLSIESLKLSD